jgi:hypothetical protein
MRLFDVQTKRRLLNTLGFVIAALVLLGGSPSVSPLAQEDEFAGERVVHLLDEPRHRTVHNDGDLYLLDVQINPGDVSLPHTHDQAILLTSISRGDGPRDGGVSANIAYATEANTHKVPNNGPGLFRIIAMVNAGSGNTNLAADRPTGLAGEPQLENAWFRSYRVELAPGEETSVQSHNFSSVVIQVADGLFHVARGDGVTTELDARADWAWHKANQSYVIRNVGRVASAVVVNEGRH